MLKNIIIRIVSITLALLLFMLPVASKIQAAPTAVAFYVNSVLDEFDINLGDGICLTDSNLCTLRAALNEANRISGTGATIFLPSGIFKLTIFPDYYGNENEGEGDLDLISPLTGSPMITITGAGPGLTIIDANKISRAFHVYPGRVAAISNVTIRNGYFAQGNVYGSDGGGIYNEGTLTVSNVTISANKVPGDGGGIFNGGNSYLIVENSTISQNYSNLYGGGIDNWGILDVRNSTLSENTARLAGGGINGGVTIKVSKSTISGNGSYDGGGIRFMDNLYVINSTISQNYANNNGGGINAGNYPPILAALYNTTIIDNDADHDRDQLGGIGGGVYAVAGARFIVVNTLIAGNTLFNAPIYNDCNGMLEVYGWNLLGDETGCTFSGNGSASWGITSLNKIGPLQSNGGPTRTHAILAGSAAIDGTIDSLGCVDETGLLLTTDQRGSPRPVGARCDVGAFEYSPLRYVYLPLTLR
jgi:CSLREA domain-containing protein